METKDYAGIAYEIKWAITHNSTADDSEYNKGRKGGITLTAKLLALRFKSDNPNFNEILFLQACGVEI